MQESDQKGLRAGPKAGFTVMEIMIVIAVVAMVTAGVILGFSSLSRSKLRSTAYLLAAAAQRSYSYSTTRNESVRLVLELEENIVLLESTEKRVLIDKEKMKEEQEEAREAAEEEEHEEEEEGKESLQALGQEQSSGPSSGFNLGVQDLSERIKSGFHKGEVPRYKPPSFEPIADKNLSERTLEDGVKFYAVYSQLFDEEVREGKAYVYFFPDGTADHTAVQIQGKSGEIYTVEILPYSARVKIYDYPYVPAFEEEMDF